MSRLLFALLAGDGVASAADWPMGGRGNGRNPVSDEKGGPTEWRFETSDQRAKGVRWSVPVGSRAIGGPVVSGGLVWVGTNNEAADPDLEREDRGVLVCFREKDGQEVYRHMSKRIEFPQDWPKQGLSGSPLAEGDRLWFVTNRREVVCLDVGPLQTGKGQPKVVWSLDMVKELKIHPRALMIPGHDTLGSPAAYKDFLYIPTGNGTADDRTTFPALDAPSLVCVRKDTGKVVWSDNSPGKAMIFGHYASPLVVEVGGKAQVIHPQADGWVRAFDAETGKLLWKFDVNRKGVKHQDRVYVVATPVFANGRVFFATGLDPEACGSGNPGRLFCLDPSKAAVAWEFTNDGPTDKQGMRLMLGSVAVSGGFVVAVDAHGLVHCLDERTGKRHWVHDTKAMAFAHPTVVDGKVYVGTQDGMAWVLALDRTKKVIAKIEAEQGIVAPPVFANGVLYVLTEYRLHAIGSVK
jgi:outer membrane protein assembly factor BamB